MIGVPAFVWRRLVRVLGRRSRATLHFMSANDHRIRDFAVLELARTGRPLSPQVIAEQLELSLEDVRTAVHRMELWPAKLVEVLSSTDD